MWEGWPQRRSKDKKDSPYVEYKCRHPLPKTTNITAKTTTTILQLQQHMLARAKNNGQVLHKKVEHRVQLPWWWVGSF